MKTAPFITLVLLSLSLSAHATKPKPPEKTPTQEQEQTAIGIGIGKGGYAMSGSESAADARAESMSTSKSLSETVVDASSDVAVGIETGDTLVETGDTILTVDGDAVTYDFASNASYAPPAFSNIKCGEVFGLGYTNLNGSGSLGVPVPRWLSRKIRDCEADADANWLAEMGLRLAAVEARCGTKSMQDRFGGTMKGQADRTTACKAKLTGLLRDEAELDGLRSAVEHLSSENRRLAEELGNAHIATDRCTQSWKDCQSK